jgi:hypothetical protein
MSQGSWLLVINCHLAPGAVEELAPLLSKVDDVSARAVLCLRAAPCACDCMLWRAGFICPCGMV